MDGSFDSDACVPFLLSRIGVQGDVSAITSPCFQDTRTPESKLGGSLFSRLSRAVNENITEKQSKTKAAVTETLQETRECRLPSPALSRIDLSTIKAEESPLAKKEVESGHKYNGRNGQNEYLLPPGSTDRSFSHDEIFPLGRVSQTKQFSRGEQSYDEPVSGELRSVRHASNDEQREANCIVCSSGVDRSVSWDINPSTELTEHCAVSSELATFQSTSLPAKESSFQGPNTSKGSLLNNGKGGKRSRNAVDEWREVEDPETGRKYYYNRKTRVSKWRLPKGAVLVTKPSNLCPGRGHSDEENELTNQIDPCSGERRLRMPTIDRVHRKEESESKLQESHSITTSHSEDEFRESSSSELKYDQEQSLTGVKNSKDELHFHQKTFDYGPRAVENSRSLSPSHLKSPQDCLFDPGNALPLVTIEDTAVFCVYCGLKCEGPRDLEHHLRTCSHFSRIQTDGLSTQIELERVMFRMWTVRRESETRGGNEENASNFESGCSDLDVLEVNHLGIQKTPKTKLDPEVNYCVERKKCPFCEEVFVKGNEFSSHLLKCTERRRARKQRRRRKKDSPDRHCDPRIRKCVTPGRRMPWE